MRATRTLTALLIALAAAGSAAAQDAPSPANLANRRAFQDAKFGLFVHWGVYSLMSDGEWVMHNRRIWASDYEKLAGNFNPTQFDAAEWVALAKAAGMKYITITSKHHDGFAMFDSKVSDYDIVDRTPYGKDVLKALAEECRKQGLKLFFYYSQLDWHHPDYYPRGRTGGDARRPDKGEWNRYLDYMDGQLRELLTQYGEIGGIWFDGWWDKPPPEADARRGLPDVREGPARAEHGGVQQGRPDRHPAPRDLRDDEQLVGLQRHGPSLQEHPRAGPLPGEGGGPRRQLPAQRGADAERQDPARVRGAAARDRPVALRQRRVDLRHARRSRRAAPVGRHHAEG
jgi:hypothetical protein